MSDRVVCCPLHTFKGIAVEFCIISIGPTIARTRTSGVCKASHLHVEVAGILWRLFICILSHYFCNNIFGHITTYPCPYAVSTAYVLPVLSHHNLSCPCPVSTPPLLHMSHQHTISLPNVLSKCDLYFPCPVRIPPLLPMSSQYTIYTAHVQSVLHLYSTRPHLFTISTIHFQTVPTLYNPCPINIASLNPMSILSVLHPYTPYPESTHLYSPCPERTPYMCL